MRLRELRGIPRRLCCSWPAKSQNLCKIYPQNLGKNRIIRSYYVNVFFKTSTLSLHFVLLSVVRWHFFAPFQTVKILFFATFPVVLPACPVWRNFELFLPIKQIPPHTKYPLKSPVFFQPQPCQSGLLRTGHTHSISLQTSNRFYPFRGQLRASNFHQRNQSLLQ